MAISGGAGNLQGPWPSAWIGHRIRCGKSQRGYSTAAGGRVALLPETAVGATAAATQCLLSIEVLRSEYLSCSGLRRLAALDRRDCALALTGFDSGSPSLGHTALNRTACARMVRSPRSSAPTTSMQGLRGLSLRLALSRSSCMTV